MGMTARTSFLMPFLVSTSILPQCDTRCMCRKWQDNSEVEEGNWDYEVESSMAEPAEDAGGHQRHLTQQVAQESPAPTPTGARATRLPGPIRNSSRTFSGGSQ